MILQPPIPLIESGSASPRLQNSCLASCSCDGGPKLLQGCALVSQSAQKMCFCSWVRRRGTCLWPNKVRLCPLRYQQAHSDGDAQEKPCQHVHAAHNGDQNQESCSKNDQPNCDSSRLPSNGDLQPPDSPFGLWTHHAGAEMQCKPPLLITKLPC